MKLPAILAVMAFLGVFIRYGLLPYTALRNAPPLTNSAPPHVAFFLGIPLAIFSALVVFALVVAAQRFKLI